MAQSKDGSLVVFSSAYTLKQIKDRELHIFMQSKDLGEYFNCIYTVNAIADLQYTNEERASINSPYSVQLDERNIVIEGLALKVRQNWLPAPLNFVLNQLSLLVFLLREVPWHNVRVIRAEDPRFNGLYGYLFAKLLGKPLIVGLWGNPERLRIINGRPMMPRLFKSISSEKRLERFILRRAKYVLSQNSENMSYALECGVSEHKTMLTPLEVGIHAAHFVDLNDRPSLDLRNQFFRDRNGLIISCISRLEKEKHVDHAIKAARHLKTIGIEFTLFLVGDGSQRESLEILCRDLELESNIFFVGNRSQNWIASFLKEVDINLAPLCGRALLETSLAGCPTVAYDVDWHSDIIKHEVTGLLANNLDISSLSLNLARMCTDPQLRESSSTALKLLVSKRLSKEEISNRLNKLYFAAEFGKTLN